MKRVHLFSMVVGLVTLAGRPVSSDDGLGFVDSVAQARQDLKHVFAKDEATSDSPVHDSIANIEDYYENVHARSRRRLHPRQILPRPCPVLPDPEPSLVNSRLVEPTVKFPQLRREDAFYGQFAPPLTAVAAERDREGVFLPPIAEAYNARGNRAAHPLLPLVVTPQYIPVPVAMPCSTIRSTFPIRNDLDPFADADTDSEPETTTTTTTTASSTETGTRTGTGLFPGWTATATMTRTATERETETITATVTPRHLQELSASLAAQASSASTASMASALSLMSASWAAREESLRSRLYAATATGTRSKRRRH